MFGKLLKHEWLGYGRLLAIVQLCGVGITLVSMGISLLPIGGVASFAAVVARAVPAGVAIYICLSVFTQFWNTVYGKSAYFTHSLPVSAATLYGVKLMFGIRVWALAVGFALGQYALLELIVQWHNPEYTSTFLYGLLHSDARFAAFVVVLCVAGALSTLILVLFALVLANRPPFLQMSPTASVILSLLVVYGVYQVSAVVSVLIPGGLRIAETPGGQMDYSLVWQTVFSLDSNTNVGIFPLAIAVVWLAFTVAGVILSIRWLRTQLCLR